MTITKGLKILWIGFGFLWISCFYTVDIFRILFVLTLLMAFLNFSWVNLYVIWLREEVTKSVVNFAIAFLFFTVIGSLILDYEGINGVGDLTQFLQALYNYVKTGQPIFTFVGIPHNYFFVHRSLSIYFLKLLFKIFPHPWVLLVWQGFFLTLPCVVTIKWYRAVCKRNDRKPEPLGELLACLTYAMMPTFLSQIVWPYTFHIMSVTLLALAYLFYYEKKWIWWAISLGALAFEKEEYSFVAIPFALLVMAEILFCEMHAQKKSQPNASTLLLTPQILVLCFTVLGAACISYFGFDRKYSDMHSFESLFGHLGKTPFAALKTFFINPQSYLSLLLRKDSLNYLWFFFATSFLWFKPKWHNLKYFIPVLPLLLINCLSSSVQMQLIKDFYALPLIVGVGAVHIFGILGQQLASSDFNFKYKSYALLIPMTLFPLFWNHQSTSRSFYNALKQWQKTRSEQALLFPVFQDKSKIVCCDERPCSFLAVRSDIFAIGTPQCQELSKNSGKNVAFVMNLDLPVNDVRKSLQSNLAQNKRCKKTETWLLELFDCSETTDASAGSTAK